MHKTMHLLHSFHMFCDTHVLYYIRQLTRRIIEVSDDRGSRTRFSTIHQNDKSNNGKTWGTLVPELRFSSAWTNFLRRTQSSLRIAVHVGKQEQRHKTSFQNLNSSHFNQQQGHVAHARMDQQNAPTQSTDNTPLHSTTQIYSQSLEMNTPTASFEINELIGVSMM